MPNDNRRVNLESLQDATTQMRDYYRTANSELELAQHQLAAHRDVSQRLVDELANMKTAVDDAIRRNLKLAESVVNTLQRNEQRLAATLELLALIDAKMYEPDPETPDDESESWQK